MKNSHLFVSVFLLLSLLIPQVISAQDAVDAPGHIAFIGTDYNVYTFAPQDAALTQISDNAQFSQSTITLHEWPMWSSSGQLAYSESVITNTGDVTLNILVAPDAQSPGEIVYTADQTYYTYASWSPANCGDGCGDLALLLNNPSGLFYEIVHLKDGEAISTTAGTGAPFYTSWSPEGTQMLWQRENARFEIYDVASNSVTETLESQPGRMLTPQWSPIDDRLLLGVRNENTTDLVIVNGSEQTVLVGGLTNPVWFNWSPDGSSVAYIDREGPVIILDASTGEEVARTPVRGVIAFFWSPDSQHIAYLTLGLQPGSFSAYDPSDVKSVAFKQQQEQQPASLAWSVIELTDGTNRRYTPFQPTNEFLYLLQYFDQFSPSHRIWSPDSRYLVFPQVSAGQRPVISLLDATLNGAISTEIAEGIIGIWSFE